MKYKHPRLEQQMKYIHPDVRDVLEEFEVESEKRGWPEPMVTHALRTANDMEQLYYKSYMLRGEDEAAAREKARRRFSWHLVGCAVDLRNFHYSPAQMTAVLAWFKLRCPGRDWEVVQHDVGAGDHVHIGRRDISWRAYPEAYSERK